MLSRYEKLLHKRIAAKCDDHECSLMSRRCKCRAWASKKASKPRTATSRTGLDARARRRSAMLARLV